LRTRRPVADREVRGRAERWRDGGGRHRPRRHRHRARGHRHRRGGHDRWLGRVGVLRRVIDRRPSPRRAGGFDAALPLPRTHTTPASVAHAPVATAPAPPAPSAPLGPVSLAGCPPPPPPPGRPTPSPPWHPPVLVPEAVLPGPPPPAPRLRAAPALSGKGLWIWQLPATEHGDIGTIIAKSTSAGLHQLWVRVGDSRDGFYAPSQLAALVPAAHQAGLAVMGWGFPYLYDPVGDAAWTQQALGWRGTDGSRPDRFAADLENPSDGP